MISGGGTPRQWTTYMILGSAFWLSIVLITNYIGLAKLSAHETFLTTTCNRKYKICLKGEFFYDLCVKSFDDCRESKSFVFPVKHIVQEEPLIEPQIDTHNYTELEQITNRKRCKSYGFFSQLSYADDGTISGAARNCGKQMVRLEKRRKLQCLQCEYRRASMQRVLARRRLARPFIPYLIFCSSSLRLILVLD